MTAYNLRSLLVAAIVLSNCITWTASRRHHTHTQQIHRTRHRRQGQGLFLSGSYVIPGGEGTGWGEWRDDSPCSRTCGGGVASQKRICLQIGPDGQPQCTGGDTKYFSCQTQDCPPDAVDFRTEQCSAYDDKDFRGVKYEWIPYTKSPNPCELNCMPRGERFYYRHSEKVIDGTRCNEDSRDVCVNGVCQPVGCDMMLGSNAREDKCLQCRGNGVNCYTHSEFIDRQDLIKGYNDLLLIPAGATSILIEEIAPSNNYLALRNNNNTYYLNGQYRIDFARTMMIAGAMWTYERSQSGFAAPDKLKCLGPTNETLILSLLLLDNNVGIQYEYSLPTRLAPKTDTRYNWVTEEFTNCSAACGGGIQTRNVTCRSSEELEVVDDKLCDENVKPAINQTCNTDVCPPEWVEEPWGECSKRCGSEGVRKREVTCQQIIANGYPSLVADSECFKLHGKKPELFQECNRDAVCPQWFIGRWKACDKLCGSGVQTRQVVCYQKTNGRIEVLDDVECEEEKPATEKPCMLAVCEGTDWIATEWTGCDTCLSKVQTRQLICASELFNVYDDRFCEYHKRPITEQPCDETKLPPCDAQWYATQWSKCSVQCGEGVQTRRVFCGVYESGSVREVEDAMCANIPKYNDTKTCSVPIEECPSQWYTGPWNKCDAECDGGERLRRVMCLRGNKTATDCPVKTSPETSERCNLHPCNPDELISVSTTVKDDDKNLPYCEDEVSEYEEVGVDEDIMVSDGVTYDPESTFSFSTLENGSGSGDYSTEDYTTEDTITTDNSTELSTSYTGSTETDDTDSTISTEIGTTDGNNTETTSTDTSEVTEPTLSTAESNTTDISENITSTIVSSLSTEISGSSETAETDSGNSTSSDSTTDGSTISTGADSSDASSVTTEASGAASTDTTESSNTESTITAETIAVTELNTTDDTSGTGSEETDLTESTITGVTDNVSTDSSATETGSTERGSTDISTEAVTTDTNSTETEPPSSSTLSSESSVTTEESTNESVTTSEMSATNTTEDKTTRNLPPKVTTQSEAGELTASTDTSDANDTTATVFTSNDTDSTTSDTVASVTLTSRPIDISDVTNTDITSDETTRNLPPKVTTQSEAGELTASTDTSDANDTTATVFTSNDTDFTTSDTAASVTSTSEPTNISDMVNTDITSSVSTFTSESNPTNPDDTTPTYKTDTTDTTHEKNTSSYATTEFIPNDTDFSTSDTITPVTDVNSTVESSSTHTHTTYSNVTESETVTTSSDSSSSSPSESTSESVTTSPESSTTAESETTPSDLSTTTSSVDKTTRSIVTESTETESSESTVASTSVSSSESSTAAESSTVSASESATTPSDLSTTSPEEKTTRAGLVTTESSASTAESSESTTAPESTTESKIDTTVESSTTSGSSSEAETTLSGVESTTAEQSTTVSGETTTRNLPESSTTPGSETTTESGSTIISSTISGTESTEFNTTESAASTELVSSTTSEPGSSTTSGAESSTTTESETNATESSTTEIVSSTEPSVAVSSGSTESELGSTTTSEKVSSDSSTTESGYSTTESNASTTTEEGAATTVGGQSTTETATTEEVTSPTGTSPRFSFATKPPRRECRIRQKCQFTQFGCCPDKKTPADGPFDKGCPKRHTCKDTDFGCCPDGVSPAQGENNKGCPVTPCEETLFGCCLSDNKTAAQGNDQDGCPPPPPACASTPYGCCADNETEAAGPNAAGCPESETTSTTEETTTTAAETTTSPYSPTVEESTSVTTESSTTMESNETSTTVEGTTVILTSTILEGCVISEFGCCYDNETAAPGPNGQGCPCNATEFGCCPDGVSPAQGENEQGCQGPCKESTYGCCPDDKTPAHGPELEGCCLLTRFGCCPDNRKPAEGPHLEGCRCENSQYGCCSDNVTAAAGPNNEGCGCQYTPHGCCPDRHTPALGPDFEGCSCHTYQFGCCPDGVSIPVGPDQQGCHCQFSTYGCCGDDKTPASGPNGAGCDCSSSKYRCCPDGETPAEGPKFQGCTGVPENQQAVCGRPQDTGPCREYRAMWFYDVEFAGCSQFWYGGCEGNGNKFATKDECEDVCVHPAPKDACNLPAMKGPCDGDYVHWYYNSTEEQCKPFRYGGCLGNSNNFDSEQLCQTQCQPEKVIDTCELPIEPGPCAGNFSGWGYNSESRRCEQFIWGGCEGNSNRFKTEAACKMRCNPTAIQCNEPQDAGNCTDKEALWSFSQSENRCVPFYYSGCGGNDNKFYSKENCQQTCPSAYEPDKCTLPPAPGDCSPYRLKWFYDTAIKRCRQFYYGGCGGNENNFDTEAQCESACHEVVVTTTTTTTLRPTQPQPEPQPEPQPQPTDDTEPSVFCLYEIDKGELCSVASPETHYAYDSRLGKCVSFQFLGCGGNRNNFQDEAYCTYYCHSAQDLCQLPMLTGSCDDSVMSWFYDAGSDSCSQFTYSGCEGNANRFESREACETRCRTGVQAPAPGVVTTHAPITVSIESRLPEIVPPECAVSPTLEECTSAGEVWFFDPEHHECVAHMNPGSGAECKHTGTYESQEACERSCGVFRGIDVCTQSVDAGPCREFVAKVYFDQESRTCKQFAYGGCLGGANRFSSFQECQQTCQAHLDACEQPLEPGECNGYVPQWYFDATHGCTQFVYTGCGGNANRFETREECRNRCTRPSPSLTTTTVAPVPEPEPESECTTPRSLAPCGGNRTVFYYDSNSKSCIASEFGNCRHPNSYPSEEACERRCGAFRGLNVCHARLDIGPCHNPVRKYYFDAATGSCQAFTYGGCAGGPNRFSTIEECQDICGDSGPAPRCLLRVDTGFMEGCRQPSVTRYHYSPNRADCMVFVYTGCGGNANNFPTYQQCRQTCVRLETNEVGCESYERQCASLKCQYGVVRAPARGGCESCACADGAARCDQLRQECDALVCPFGVRRLHDAGCERCECSDDPCVSANCAANQRCVATAYTDPVTGEDKYTARCSEVEPDCKQQRDYCDRLQCQYGVEKSVDSQGCESCKCVEEPCQSMVCSIGERCVLNAYRDIMGETKYSPECRPTTKPGYCPVDQPMSNEVTCDPECNDDADCRGVGKCCSRGCKRLCLVPAANPPPVTTTYAPEVPAAPQAVPQQEPELTATEGGKAVLRCLFHGNPPPRITWRFGELTIDGDVGRYRLTSEGALEIISLYRNDTGVYICVADNELGRATQEIHLVVNDPVKTAAGIAGDENAVVTGELNHPISISCLAYGYPPPGIYWEHHGAMVAFNDATYEIRGNTLLIRSLAIETLGQYTCQAYNGVDKAASWVVTVRAYQPEGLLLEHEYLVPRRSLPVTTRAPTPTPTRQVTTTTSTTTTTERQIFFTVPVSTHVSTTYSSLRAGQELRILCEVDGYPDPNVYWTKDSARISPDDRISISGSAAVSRLVIARVAVTDSGLYGCHAENDYSSSTDNAQITVQQSVLPAKCTDNPFFANCDLIVRSKFCNHKYYSKFCCKSCVEAGQLDPRVAEMQADQPFRRKK